MTKYDQPYLDAQVSCVRAPALALSTDDGQIRAGGASGLYVSDCRLADELVVRVDGVEPTPIAHGFGTADEAWFVSVARSLGDPIADPTVTLDRRRTVLADGMREVFSLLNNSLGVVRTTMTLRCAADLAPMEVVKSGRRENPVIAEYSATGLTWSDARVSVALDAVPPADSRDDAAGLRWDVAIGPGQSWEVVVTISSIQTSGTLFRSADQAGLAWSKLRVSAGDVRLTRLVDRGLQDLAGLLLVDPLEPRDRFIAAGAPWFLTLFGRDSLWAARFMLPTGTAIAASTLRTLARRQGRVVDAERAEEPGKILHEVRRADLGADIPFAPVYYGTVDATPLWICLLCDAWRWGMADADVAELIPNLERALAWMRDFGDADGDGFLEYRPSSVDGQGLSNQGWKDSDDAIQWLDGRLAESPIALCEVQGYAYEAATKAAALLDAFRRPGADGWRTWAEQLGKRFRDAFWVDNHGDSYPAIALDRHKHRVDAASSNIGHLLSTGILDDHECELVARRLAKLDMDSGWGLRTMTAASPRFNPLSYHGGSVWPHDTAIAIMGLAATGHGDVAASLSGGLVAAAEAFDFRLPELYGGHQAEAGRTPIPYPAACRPQAWAAVVGVAIVTALLGVRPDVPAGRVEIAPLDGQPFGALVVDGVVIGGRAVRIQHDGLTTTLTGAAPGLSIDISHTLVPLPSVG